MTMKSSKLWIGAGVAVVALAAGLPTLAQRASEMTFFVTSVGTGKGADLGGLAGADAHCQQLAQAVGAGHKTWRAYLSTQAEGGQPAVNAKDRIGKGPWKNFMGVTVAKDVADLHSDASNMRAEHVLTEKGHPPQYAGDGIRTQHDILTGSQMDGTAYPPGEDRTCGNWSKSTDGTGAAIVGHADRRGLQDDVTNRSWNSSHPTRGCSAPNMVTTGGAGLFYCFATN
jgi:hypothetical protein